jgi:hypothetical protein
MAVRRIDTPGEAIPHVACRKISRNPKSRVNLDRPLRKTHVGILSSSRIQSLGGLECVDVKTLEVSKSGVHLDHSSKGTCVGRSTSLEIRSLGEMECDDVKSLEVPMSIDRLIEWCVLGVLRTIKSVHG